MRYLDLSNEATLEPLIRMLQRMSGGSSSKEILADFLGQYGRVRPVDAFVGVKPDADGYRVMYAVRTKDAVNGKALHTRDVNPEALALLELRRGGFFGEVMAEPKPKMVYDVPAIDDPTAGPVVSGLRSCMCLPIFKGEEVFEWTFAFSSAPDGVIQPRDVGQATVTANLLGAANRHADAVNEIERLNGALRTQLDGIARVQQSLLPAKIPEIPAAELATSYLTSDEAGGDYYDFFPLPGGRWGILIADVSGHGAAAATVMAMLHAILHCYDPDSQTGPDPAAIMKYANERLFAARLDGMFVTAFFCVLDPVTGELAYCNCGHNPPRLKRGSSGEVAALDGGGATVPLGILDDAAFVTERLVLGVNDTVVLYTDGITEAFGMTGEMFGDHRLDAALTTCTGQPDCVVDSVHKALFQHRGKPTRDDDQTIVALRYHGLCAIA
ncbi:MAG: SpoIIE family protein phosphatase [Planctomycetes bacterium]|nr:SpoIIE family protein phosphatase [Planctomycetota bacterium]